MDVKLINYVWKLKFISELLTVKKAFDPWFNSRRFH